MNKIPKILVVALLVIAGLVLATVATAYLVYPAEYLNRLLLWGGSDVNDYQKFPARPLHASSSPYYFKVDADEARVRALFESDAEIDDLEGFLEETGTQAFIVIRDDVVLYEKYFNGAKRDSIVTSFSVAKSFTSALIGVAIADGYIGSVDDSISAYLPELAERDPAFSEISIRDLLMMSSGIRYVEFPFINGDDAKTYYYPDLRRLALEQTRISGSPGKTFLYNNYHPLLLGLILERATGMPVAEYLDSRIWGPIGAEFDGSWSLDGSGFEKMESGINGRAIDFAKFARLFLNGGNWDGVQVLPAEWVAESIREEPERSNPEYYADEFGREIFTASDGGYYKYMWYGFKRGGGPVDFAAEGNLGQIMYISPQKNLIVIRHGERFGLDTIMAWPEILYRFASRLEN